MNNIRYLTYFAYILFAFNLSAHATVATRTQSCDLILQPRALHYRIENFLGRFQLRLHVLPDGVQVIFFPSLNADGPQMQAVINRLFAFYFGERYSQRKEPRAFSDSDIHGWLKGPITDNDLKAWGKILKNLVEMPNTPHYTPYSFTLNRALVQMAEKFANRNFPHVSEHRALKAILGQLGAFANRLPRIERILLDKTVLNQEPTKPDEQLEKVILFIYGQTVDSAQVREAIRQKWLTQIRLSFADRDPQMPPQEWYDDGFIMRSNDDVIFTPSGTVNRSLDETAGHGPWEKAPATAPSFAIADAVSFANDPLLGGAPTIDWSIRVRHLSLPEPVRSKLIQTGAVFIFELYKFTARDYFERFGFTRSDMMALLDELNVHGLEMHFEGNWDRDNHRIRRDRPEYYQMRHTPKSSIIQWPADLPDEAAR